MKGMALLNLNAAPLSIGALTHSFASMPAGFYARQAPSPVADPAMVVFNDALAAELSLDTVSCPLEALTAIFAGNALPTGADPIAMAYAGHQFGHFTPQLGDGRAILLGEVIDRAGSRRDIQLKGAGRTAFSRGGDGRAALGPVLREYLISEAMHALGVPTTRALAAVTTGEAVLRDRPLPGAVLTRIAASNIRVGTFQYFAARGDYDAVEALADYVIDRHYADARQAENPYLALLEAVVARQASLVARWLNLGFVHGVMNTDNMAVSGETIDYGPCAFIDAYDPATVFSSIDDYGRYAFKNQPAMAQWNLTRFAETLVPLLGDDEQDNIACATRAIMGFGAAFDNAWLAGMRCKLGLTIAEDGDRALAQSLLAAMHKDAVDFTLCFRMLGEGLDGASARARVLFQDKDAFDHWREAWHQRCARESMPVGLRAASMRAENPAVIPRNHIVEQVLAAATRQGDYAPFHECLGVLLDPYTDRPAHARYAEPPAPGQSILRTFCGT
ncbi:MAG: YdiU family protein [Acidocella sp.]|nr:YdiU family protein [Acidocella sp.]